MSHRSVYREPVVSGCALLLVLMSPVCLSAQDQRHTNAAPGWVLTSALALSGTWDNNVSLSGHGDENPEDYLATLNPRTGLRFRGRRTTMAIDYSGTYSYYRDLRELNSYEQRGAIAISRRMSSRISLFADNNASIAPTTEEIDLEAISFRRIGTRMDVFRTGVNLALSRRTSVTGTYMFQWADFDREDRLAALFRGGHGHGRSLQLRHQLTSRWAIGAQYDMRDAYVAGRTRHFEIQNAAAVIDVSLTPTLSAAGMFGYARMDVDELPRPRVAPAFGLTLSQHVGRRSWGLGYHRSFLPSFGFGGTFQNEELRGSFVVPLGRRLEWNANVAGRESEPLIPSEYNLRGLWARSALTLHATRWMTLEAFYSHVFQDSRRPGGKVDRTRTGFRIITVKPVRLH